MSSLYDLQSTFNRGEISPLLASRADVDFWKQSLSYCRNFQVLTHGGLRRRSGSRYIAALKNSAQVGRLLPFKFSETQSYVLALNDGYIRFFALRATVGAPYQITHPWGSADLKRLSYAQFNDVAYFAHKNYAPRKLTRSGDTSWAIADTRFSGGPFLPMNTTATKLTPSATGNLVPKMTSNTAPSGTASASSELSGSVAWRAFDQDVGTNWNSGTTTDGTLGYDFAGSTTKVAAGYMLTGARIATKSPTTWSFEGYDGTNWVVLDVRQGQTLGSRGSKYYEVNNSTAYQAYQINITANDGDTTNVAVSAFAIAEDPSTAPTIALTASSTTGINGGAGFTTSDIGRLIRLSGEDNLDRVVRIVSRTSSTVVQVALEGAPLPSTGAILRWALGSFSSQSGWPGSVALYDERLMWARTDAQPVTVWGSKQGIFDEYGISSPLVGTDALSITLLSSNMNELLWIADDEDLITGSGGQIRSIGPSDSTQSFSAVNITQTKGPTSGASYLQPLSVGGVVLYAGDGATKIRELVLGDQNRYVAPELTILAEHMFKTGIVDWAFSEKPDPTIWVVTSDGLLVSITYDREQKVLGFSRHDLGGNVENVAVIPGTTAGYDDLYMVVKRTINGSTARYVEVLEKPFDGDTDSIEDAFFVDCGLTYDGTPITTVTGLAHLEGERVLVLADGGVVRGLTVSGGSITLPNAASVIHVGLEYTSRAVTLPVAGPISKDGVVFGRRRSVVAGSVDTLHTGALKVGAFGSDNWTPPLYEQIMKQGGGLFGSPIDLKSGFTRCDIDGSWAEGDGKVVLETSEPLPALIRSFVFQIEGEP